MRWLDANQPADSDICVIHNDYRLDNVVLAPEDPTRIIGVLDWEMATLGDPLMDLGGALAYWVEAGDGPMMKWLRRQPSDAPGSSPATRWSRTTRGRVAGRCRIGASTRSSGCSDWQ